MPWAGILYPTSDKNLEQILDGTHRDVLHLNKNFWKIDDKVLKLAKFIKDNRHKMKFRLQQKHAIFYSDKQLSSEAVLKFWEYWIRSETVNPLAKKIGKNTTLCTRLPYNKYKFQIHLKQDAHKHISEQEKKHLWKFFKTNHRHIFVSSQNVLNFLSNTKLCYGGYFYVSEEKFLTPLYMMAQKIIEKVIKFKKVNNGRNKKVTRR